MTIHTKRYHKSAFFFQITPDFAFIDPSVSAAYLECTACFVAEIQLFFHPQQKMLRSPKQQFLYVSNFSIYASITHCVYYDPGPRGFVAIT